MLSCSSATVYAVEHRHNILWWDVCQDIVHLLEDESAAMPQSQLLTIGGIPML
jgi:hypothetical protein